MEDSTENITVEQAISRGRKMILIPCLTILFGPAVVTYLVTLDPYAVMVAPMILLLGAGIAAVYRAYAIPRWKVWAFSKVRNVHELKRRAEFAWLIPSDENAGFRKFENWSDAQKQAWQIIEKKFDLEDEFVERSDVPAEMKVYFAWYKKFGVMLLSLVMVGFGIVSLLIYKHDRSTLSLIWQSLLGLFFTAVGGWLFYHALKQLVNRKPQIVMNSTGLQTAKNGFYTWSEIRDLRVVASGNGRHRTFHLKYWAGRAFIDFELDGLTIGRRKLDRYLRTYQGRHQYESGSLSFEQRYIV